MEIKIFLFRVHSLRNMSNTYFFRQVFSLIFNNEPICLVSHFIGIMTWSLMFCPEKVQFTCTFRCVVKFFASLLPTIILSYVVVYFIQNHFDPFVEI